MVSCKVRAENDGKYNMAYQVANINSSATRHEAGGWLITIIKIQQSLYRSGEAMRSREG